MNDLFDAALEQPVLTAALTGTVAAATAHFVGGAEPTTTAVVGGITFLGTLGLCKALAPTPYEIKVGGFTASAVAQGKVVSVKLTIPRSEDAAARIAGLAQDLPENQRKEVEKMFKPAA